MELTISDDKTKELIVGVLEETGIGNAIVEGRKGDFVSEESIFAILEDRREGRKEIRS